ncbi:Hypothetical predicted protein [Mytilus galloprovincialis]|uniref:Mab-21-like HhH/H2TH-like domain-containing protein n=1 Tax=Mytilus galloprovincialis TaxID=29158 RepID=A0A8B6F456_MYTGA|nr:Hypothetical predicted protein [Mytilus galloprovincialis]
MDTEADLDQNRLSEVVSDILKCEGFFMEHIHVFRSECLLSEKIAKDLFGITEIKCGSMMAEGSHILGSDMDIMHVSPGIIAVNGDCNFFDEKMHILKEEMDKCLPGYTRLLVHRLNPKSHFLPDIQTIIKKDGNSLYLSSEEYLKIFKNVRTKSWTFPYANANFYSHGPCTTASIYNLKGISFNIEYDMTCGIKCHSWPVAATEWLHRPRLMGWPSIDIVEKIASFPVHVMPVGDPKSEISSMQWRFAFSYAERELIWNFSDIQFQSYILLKSIFKGKIEALSPNELSGYQMKTLLFWISEEYGVKIFTKENLLHCLEICFDRLKHHISHSSLPHYILRDRNLLEAKLDMKTRNRIVDEITKILADIFVSIFECRHIVLRSSKYLNAYKGSKTQFISRVMTPLVFGLMKCPKTVTLQIFLESFKVCTGITFLTNNFEELRTLIEEIHSGKNFSVDILPYMLKTAKLFAGIQLGMMFYEDSIDDKAPEQINILLGAADLAFKMGTDLDEFSGKLYFATFALSNNKIDCALSILFPIMCNTKPFIYSGWCSKKKVLQFSNNEIHYIDYDTIDEKVSNCNDIVFPKTVVHFVPEPIKYELFLQQCTKQWQFCLYHPVVYAFFLMFEITRKINGPMIVQNEILGKLSTFIEDCKGGYERHRAYNLLGSCYYKCGRKDEAIDIYCRSLQEQSDNKNVAIYHLCILLLEKITSKTSVLYSRTQ